MLELTKDWTNTSGLKESEIFPEESELDCLEEETKMLNQAKSSTPWFNTFPLTASRDWSLKHTLVPPIKEYTFHKPFFYDNNPEYIPFCQLWMCIIEQEQGLPKKISTNLDYEIIILSWE